MGRYTWILFFLSTVTAVQRMPKQLPVCHKNDPDIDLCLQNAIQESLPVLAKGIPEAWLIPLDPMVASYVNLYQNHGFVELNLTMWNIITEGYSKGKVLRVKSDIDNYKLEITIRFPKLFTTGNYRMVANVLFLPLQGVSEYEMYLDNVTATVELVGIPVTRKREIHMRLQKVSVDLNIEQITFDFGNLLNGGKDFGKAANEFLNRNNKRILQEVKPLSEEALSKIIHSTANGFYNRVPYNQIYL